MTDEKSNRAARQQKAQNARERAAAARREQQRADQVRRAQRILSLVLAVVVVGAVIAYVAIRGGGHSEANSPVPPAVLSQVTGVPQSVLDQVGKGSSTMLLKPVSDTSLESGGKPAFLYVGGEFCPFCAGERWAIVQALSRFGAFSGLREIRSSENDFPTFDFRSVTYTSKYLTFSAKEVADQSHHTLQKLSSSEQAVFSKYSPEGGFPFWYVSGGYQQGGRRVRRHAAVRSDPGEGRSRAVRSVQPADQVDHRRGERAHRRDLQGDRRPAWQSLHVAGGQLADLAELKGNW